MKRKEYCYKVILSPEKIFYIGCPFGRLYHVFATDENHTFNYSVYGGYKNIGTASNKLIEMAKNENNVKMFYASKELILKNDAFGM